MQRCQLFWLVCRSLEMSLEGGSSDGDGDQVVPHMPGTKAAGIVSKAKSTPSDGLAVLSKTAAAAGNPAAPLQMGLLDTILRTEWDDRKAQGLFRSVSLSTGVLCAVLCFACRAVGSYALAATISS